MVVFCAMSVVSSILLRVSCFAVVLQFVSAGASLLGLGGSSGGSLKGATFAIDTTDKKISRIHGAGNYLFVNLSIGNLSCMS